MSKRSKVDEKNYVISAEDANILRRAYLKGPMQEYVRRFMNDHPLVESVLIQVSQYYNDEASDAVHFHMYPSVLDMWWEPAPPAPWKDKKGRTHTPSKPNYYNLDITEDGGRALLEKNLPFVDLASVQDERKGRDWHPRSLYDIIYRWSERAVGSWGNWLRDGAWDSNGAMIPLFAAFCTEDGGSSAFTPLCVYRRTKEGNLAFGDVTMEFVGTMLTPERDGIRPHDAEGEAEEGSKLFDWIKEKIRYCEESKNDPLSAIRNHFQRRDLVTHDEERKCPPGFLIWGYKGPAVREDEAEKFVKNDDAMREVQAEWDRRKAFDLEFSRKYKF